jgi:putative peptidoglycan lipid II flippase
MFGNTPRFRAITASLTRIVLPTQICFFVGSILISVQYSLKRFAVPALGSIIYNLFIIAFGILLGNPKTGLGPAGFSWGALVGAIIGNFLVQIWGIVRVGGRYRPMFNLKDPAVHRFGKLLLPIVFTISLPYLDMYVNRYFATFLPGDGAVASLNYANRLMQLPLGILAQASAIVIFPFIASQAARQDMDGLKRSLNMSIRTIVAMTLPASVLMIALAEPIVRLIYQRGEFDRADTVHTAPVLVFYCLGIAAWSAQSVLARGFYALQDTKRPMITGSIVTVIFIVMNWALVGPMKENGLALATSLAATLFAIVLFFQLQHRLGGLNAMLIVKSFGKVALAGALMAVPTYGLRLAFTYLFTRGGAHTSTALGGGATLLMVLFSATAGLATYAGLLWFLRVDEAQFLWQKLSARLRRK